MGVSGDFRRGIHHRSSLLFPLRLSCFTSLKPLIANLPNDANKSFTTAGQRIGSKLATANGKGPEIWKRRWKGEGGGVEGEEKSSRTLKWAIAHALKPVMEKRVHHEGEKMQNYSYCNSSD